MSPRFPNISPQPRTTAMAGKRPQVVLIGPPASGKTKIGKLVARELVLPFIDTDQIVAGRYGPIPEIFREHGEPWFRSREEEAVTSALDGHGVVSLGGGAVTTESIRNALFNHRVVWLTISPDAVAPRLNNDKRPLLAGGLEDWKKLVAAREPLYREVASHQIDVSHRPIDEVATDIVAWVKAGHD